MGDFFDTSMIITALGTIVVLFVALGGYQYYSISNDHRGARAKLASTTDALASSTQRIEQLEENNKQLSEQLQAARDENEKFEEQIEDIAEKVGILEQIQKTDKELLKKYSKVYFLNENYVPSDFEEIDSGYVHGDEREHVHAHVWPYLEDLLEDAEDDGIDLRVISAYRSFNEQGSLKSHYTVQYGSGANQFSAEQGYSEHQLGTTVDFTTENLGGNFTQIDTTKAFEWLQENAHEYGFILSYPEGNQYYQYEPWHWRFVGEELATDLHEDDMHFYDMQQREIDQYLPKLFQ